MYLPCVVHSETLQSLEAVIIKFVFSAISILTIQLRCPFQPQSNGGAETIGR